MRSRFLALLLTAAQLLPAWGLRAHRELNRAAIQALPENGPAFLKAHEDYIGFVSISPDTWRLPSEMHAKIFEDPNHGWFQEQAQALMANPPRSRYEFLLALSDLQRKSGDKLTNVRWTGTLPYAAMEAFERVRAGMRRYRQLARNHEVTRFAELEIATHASHLGHYIGDAANPMHVSIHHDGWVGDNPKGFTTDPRVHGRFESAFVDLIGLQSSDLAPLIKPARVLDDPFAAIMQHIAFSFAELENVYELDKAGAFTDKDHAEGRAIVYKLLAQASNLLRDLLHTAWIQSGEPISFDRSNNPTNPEHPRYNPATGYTRQGTLEQRP